MKKTTLILRFLVLGVITIVSLGFCIHTTETTSLTSRAFEFDSSRQMAIKGKLLFEDKFKTLVEYTKEYQTVKEGWSVRAGHAMWKHTREGVQSIWEAGHMPVLVYSGTFGDAVIEVDFRFHKEEGKWAACRISATNPELNPRAYAASVWANSDNKGRALGMVLEHDEWKPGVITTVDSLMATFEPDKWYTLRLELIGNHARATCNGVSVYGTHEKFGIPKNSISLGVGTCEHELRNFRVYEATVNPKWEQPAPKKSGENKIRLNDHWKFLKSDLGGVWEAVRPVKEGNPESVPLWENVSLPHCFNATDAVDPDVNYYQGPGWYTNQLEINNPYSNGRTLLYFEGAGQKTDVFIYTTKVGSHIGGYNEWSVDITDAVKNFLQDKTVAAPFKGKIPLSIRCDNSRDLEMIPSDLSDFNVYGGIYRYLNLEYVPSFSIERLFVNAKVDAKGVEGKFDLNLKVQNKSAASKAHLKIEISDPKGKQISVSEQDITSFEGEKSVFSNVIKKPELWSPGQPNLYTGTVTISSESGIQSVSEKFGFRDFEFVDYGPFKLNGTRLLLRGTHRHEDHAGVAAAMTEPMIRAEMKMMKEMGVNFIRLGHYQQSRIVLNLCDSLGIFVWEEIPWCRGGLGGDRYKQQARNMLTDMIDQHRNHPSVIIWGLGNENDWPGDFPEFDKEKIRDFMTELNTLSHKLDPTRMTAIRRCDFCKDIVDVYSPSIWAGWYRGIYTEYRESTEKEIKGVKHFFHAEWGGDSHALRHSEAPDKTLQQVKPGGGADERLGDASLFGGAARVSKDGDWSESYICNLIDWHLKEQENLPALTGSAYWPFKDFSTPVRPDNPIPYMNQKGVVERDLTKKEAWFVFQSWWTDQPMVHIYGHSWPIRWGDAGEQKMVKVYSNCDEAELFVNGKSYGSKKRNGQDFPAAGLRWNVVYSAGENDLKVIARKGRITVTDEIKQAYQTDKWGAPAQMIFNKIDQKGDIVTLEVKLVDANKILCLDARNVVTFGLTGDGQLIDNLGTSSGSRKVELYNGRAIIRVNTKGGPNMASVACAEIPTVFCNLVQN